LNAARAEARPTRAGVRAPPTVSESARSRFRRGAGRSAPHRPLPAREVRSTRRVVRGRRRRVRMAGVAEGPKVPEQTQAICKAHPTRRQVIVGAVALRCVERRCVRRTAAAENRLSPLRESCRRQEPPTGITSANATLAAKDIEKLLWCLAVLILPLIGLIVWYFAGPGRKPF
jgi:hypothetical protein